MTDGCASAASVSSGKKRIKWILPAAAVVLLAYTLLSGWFSHAESVTIETLYAMYGELETLPDFDGLFCREGSLYLLRDDARIEAPPLPCCLEARSSGRVKGVAKIGDDIFFYLHGFVDNYTGYVLSRDTVIDLNELDSVERKMEYEHGLKCYAIFSR